MLFMLTNNLFWFFVVRVEACGPQAKGDRRLYVCIPVFDLDSP